MALSISEAGKKVIDLLKANRIAVDSVTEAQLRTKRYIKLFGYNCMVANVMSSHTFRVRVNMAWFSYPHSNKSKPRMNTQTAGDGFDFQLIPTKKVLYTLYYLRLREHTFLLELDKEKWVKKPWWGIRVNEDKGNFVWEGGNTICFPLIPFSTPQSLSLQLEKYSVQHEVG